MNTPRFRRPAWPVPGRFVWLVGHDLRLAWRDGISGLAHRSRLRALLIAILGLTMLHLVAWKLAMPFLPRLAGDGAAEVARAPGAVVLALVALLAWMTAQGVNGAVRTLYDRGDLDLLLAAPIPASTIFSARAITIAASSFGSLAILLLPVAHVAALVDSPRWLAIYSVLAATALAGTAIGAVIAMALFRRLGPARARRVASIAAAVIAGFFVIGGQLLLLLPDAFRVAATEWALRIVGHGAIAPDSLLLLPVRAALGEGVAQVGLLACAAALLAAVTMVLGHRFAEVCRAVSGAADHRPSTVVDRQRLGFKPGAERALRAKEWRLLARDPSLIQQLALQLIYTLPIVVILMRSDAGIPVALAIGPALVVIAAQLTGSLAWIATSGEDAPELIAAAPVMRRSVERAKIAAVALPVAALIAIPVAGLAVVSAKAAAVTLAVVVAACVSTALVNLWHQKPANKRGLLRRHSQSKLVAILEHTLSLLWAVALVLAVMGSLLALIPAGLAVVVLTIIRPRHRKSGQPWWRRLRAPAHHAPAIAGS